MRHINCLPLLCVTTPIVAMTTPIVYSPRHAPVVLGLIDWMLDAPHLPPMKKLCRAEGWEASLRLNAAVARTSVGLRFYHDNPDEASPSGSVELKLPSASFCDEGSRWETVELSEESDGSPSVIRLLLRTSEAGVSAGGRLVVPPNADLICMLQLTAPTEDGNLLREGELSVAPAPGQAAEVIGRCEMSPFSLMGSN